MSITEISTVASYVPILISLVAVIFGPCISMRISTQQILSTARQKWNDALTELMSEVLSECQNAIVIGEGRGLLNEKTTDEPLFRKLLYLEQKLSLMLDPNKDDHLELLRHVHDITDATHHGAGNLLAFGASVTHAIQATQNILKNERSRVKSGKFG